MNCQISTIPHVSGCRGTNQDTEVRLINDLLKDYDLDARPVKNRSDPVSVELRISYRELKELVRVLKIKLLKTCNIT